jgi:integrase
VICDRALIATLTYSFARISAALKMKVEDLPAARRRLDDPAPRERRQVARHTVPSRACRGAAGLHRRGRHHRGPQGLAVPHRARAQRQRLIPQKYEPAGRPAHDPPARRGGRHRGGIGCHTFRATGITAYLANGGALEHAQEMAPHESPRTTKLYVRTKERLTQDEVESITL